MKKFDLQRFLNEPYPDRVPVKKDKHLISELTGSFTVRPIRLTIKRGGATSFLHSLVSQDGLRPAQTGVYHNAKTNAMVATDAMVLGHLPAIVEETKLVGVNGKLIEEVYPDYISAIPRLDRCFRVTDIEPLVATLNSITLASRHFDMPLFATIETEIGKTCFIASDLLRAIQFLYKAGSKSLLFSVTMKASASIIRDEHNLNLFALVMNVQAHGHAHVQVLKATTEEAPLTVLIDNCNREGDYLLSEYEKSIQFDAKQVLKAESQGLKDFHQDKIDEKTATLNAKLRDLKCKRRLLQAQLGVGVMV